MIKINLENLNLIIFLKLFHTSRFHKKLLHFNMILNITISNSAYNQILKL